MPVELMNKGGNKWENRSYQKSENHNLLGWEDSKATSSPEQICLLFPTLLAFLSWYNLFRSSSFLLAS